MMHSRPFGTGIAVLLLVFATSLSQCMGACRCTGATHAGEGGSDCRSLLGSGVRTSNYDDYVSLKALYDIYRKRLMPWAQLGNTRFCYVDMDTCPDDRLYREFVPVALNDTGLSISVAACQAQSDFEFVGVGRCTDAAGSVLTVHYKNNNRWATAEVCQHECRDIGTRCVVRANPAALLHASAVLALLSAWHTRQQLPT